MAAAASSQHVFAHTLIGSFSATGFTQCRVDENLTLGDAARNSFRMLLTKSVSIRLPSSLAALSAPLLHLKRHWQTALPIGDWVSAQPAAIDALWQLRGFEAIALRNALSLDDEARK